MNRGRFGANVQVFQRDERTGTQRLVHTSFRRLPPCGTCGGILGGNVVAQGRSLVHGPPARCAGVRLG